MFIYFVHVHRTQLFFSWRVLYTYILFIPIQREDSALRWPKSRSKLVEMTLFRGNVRIVKTVRGPKKCDFVQLYGRWPHLPYNFFCTGRDLKNGTCRCMYSYEKMVYGVQKCDFVHRTPYTTSTGLNRLVRPYTRCDVINNNQPIGSSVGYKMT